MQKINSNFTKLDLFVDASGPICYGILKPGNNFPGGIPVIKVKNIIGGAVITDDLLFTTPEIHKQYKRAAVKTGDLLLTIRGTTGRVAIVPQNLNGANITQDTARIRVSSDDCSEYVYYALQSADAQRQIKLNTVGQAVKGINIAEVKKLKIYHPSRNEQEKIAAILSTWDQAIDLTKQLLFNSQRQKKSLMQMLLTGKNRFPGMKNHWVEYPLSCLIKEIKRPVVWDEASDYKLLSVKRRSEGVVLREILQGHQILTKKMNTAHSGDFLISKMQVVHGAMGLVTPEHHGHHISDSYIGLISKDETKIDIEFFAWYCKQKSMYHKAFLCSYGVHIEKMTFNFTSFLKEKIKIPQSIEEQKFIVLALNTAEREIEIQEQKLALLELEKKSLMQKLLDGECRLRVEAA